MSNDVTVSLKAVGASEVSAALKSVRQSIVDMDAANEASTAAAIKASHARVAALRKEVSETKALAKETGDVLKKMRQEETFKTSIGKRRDGGFGREPSARQSITGSNTASGAQGGGGGVMDSFMDGKGAAGMLKAAGVAGVAIGLFKAGIDLASAALKQFSAFVLNDVIKPAMAMETKAVQIANSSGGKLTAADVQSKARATGIRNNVDPMAVIEGAGIFQDATGESKLGFDMMSTIATLSKSRGFDMKEMTGLAGALYKPGMAKADLDQLLLAQTAQGDMGSITLGQMAKLGGKLTAPAGNFAGDYGTRIAMSGALLQSSRKGFGSVDETASGLAAFVTDSMHAGKAFSPRSMVKGADGVEKIADPAKLIGDIFRKTAGNSVKLTAGGYSESSAKLLGAYKEPYSEAFASAKAGGSTDAEAKEKAAAAVEALIKTFVVANTTMESEESKRNAVLQTSGEKWEAAMAQIKDRLLAIMPKVAEFVDSFAKNAPLIADAALQLANAILWVAGVIKDILSPFAKTDKEGTGPGSRGRYVMNLETGAMEFKKDSEDVYGERGKKAATVLTPEALKAAGGLKGFVESQGGLDPKGLAAPILGGVSAPPKVDPNAPVSSVQQNATPASGAGAATAGLDAHAKSAEAGAKKLDEFSIKLDGVLGKLGELNRNASFGTTP
jgi:hypothetical protein